jgi:hypothetical protein
MDGQLAALAVANPTERTDEGLGASVSVHMLSIVLLRG